MPDDVDKHAGLHQGKGKAGVPLSSAPQLQTKAPGGHSTHPQGSALHPRCGPCSDQASTPSCQQAPDPGLPTTAPSQGASPRLPASHAICAPRVLCA